MRKLNVVLAALVLGACGFSSAATNSVSVTNSGTDTLQLTGTGLSVDFINSEFGTSEQTAGTANLAYSAQDNTADGDRKITVSLDVTSNSGALPDGMTINLVASGLTQAAGDAGTAAPVSFIGTTLGAQDLIEGITQFTSNATALVTYKVIATRGFETVSGTLTYTIAHAF